MIAGCKSKPREAKPVPRDAVAIIADAKEPWPQLAGYPHVEPERVIALPTRGDVPRFDVGGPVIAGGFAVVASSQFGFLAIDYKTGAVAWSKPAGLRVAPPLVREDGIVLIGECLNPPVVADREQLLGCLRVVTPGGADQAYLAIRAGLGTVEDFASAAGPQALWSDGERVRWRRGDTAVSIDVTTGAAKPAPATPPPLVVTKGDRRWEIGQVEGKIVARGREPWQTEHAYTAVIGIVTTHQSPLLRVVNLGAVAGTPEVHLFDMDATGSLRAAHARPTPGIQLLGHAVSSIGDAAIAVRMDTSLRHDFLAGYAANAMLMWVYALPEVPRADPVGVAIAPDGAVVVFHDGDLLTVLPELSAPPTAPGAGHALSPNPTP